MIWAGNKYIPAPTLEQAPDFSHEPGNKPPPSKPDDDDDKYLVRFGHEPESAQKLADDANRAAANPYFGHGVSTTLKSRISGTDKNHRSASLSEVRKYFIVKPTPTFRDPNHNTVVLPQPVTNEVANKFNSLFKPKM